MHYYKKVYDDKDREIYSFSKTPIDVEGYSLYDDNSDALKYEIIIDGGVQRIYPILLIYTNSYGESGAVISGDGEADDTYEAILLDNYSVKYIGKNNR